LFTSTIISLIISLIIICWVYELTKVVTEPSNYKKVAENNDAVRKLWVFAVASGVTCTIINTRSLPIWSKVLDRYISRIIVYSNEPPSSGFGSILHCITSVGRLFMTPFVALLLPFLVIAWGFGPFIV